jgi:hypothetical protein
MNLMVAATCFVATYRWHIHPVADGDVTASGGIATHIKADLL